LARPTILDRYMFGELVGPFLFGLSAFALIFMATYLLNVSRLVVSENAPLGVAIEYFIWQVPSIIVLVVPIAMLLGVLLMLQRLSGESEIVAMYAGGISLYRVAAPLLIAGLGVSFVALVLQETVVPFANDRARIIREEVAKQVALGGSDSIAISLPSGGRQFTTWTTYHPEEQTIFNVTLVQYDRHNRPVVVAFARRAQYDPATSTWRFVKVREYHFGEDGEIYASDVPRQSAGYDIGEGPAGIARRLANENPDEMSRAQIREVLGANVLDRRSAVRYQAAYDEKLARPFASFVFALLAIPFGLRQSRGGANTSLGFGLAILIGFVYFVVLSITSAITETISGGPAVSALGAWLPNLMFIGVGWYLVRRSAGS
jgi:lipopolysaccharide export system permease protein